MEDWNDLMSSDDDGFGCFFLMIPSAVRINLLAIEQALRAFYARSMMIFQVTNLQLPNYCRENFYRFVSVSKVIL